jgi:hypothetical protein
MEQTALLQATEKKLPSPAVLKDILSELTERQRSEEREVALAASAAAGPKGPRVTRQLSTSTSMTFEGEVSPPTSCLCVRASWVSVPYALLWLRRRWTPCGR